MACGDELGKQLGKQTQLAERCRRVMVERPFRQRSKPRQPLVMRGEKREAEALLAAAKVAELLDRYDLSLTDVEIRDAPCEQREIRAECVDNPVAAIR
jgi:hypothetical protein